MNRIAATFSNLKSINQKVLIPFITAGDPKPEVTVPLMHTLVKAGANLIELGVPFLIQWLMARQSNDLLNER